ncbi:hypothetical protein BDN67DRAFT_1010429 [Paxillus ammoniavirescens]|nr:hypothetical protein BDN67DRAFT_1010429 [Paxillus ammoniavirescens]
MGVDPSSPAPTVPSTPWSQQCDRRRQEDEQMSPTKHRLPHQPFYFLIASTASTLSSSLSTEDIFGGQYPSTNLCSSNECNPKQSRHHGAQATMSSGTPSDTLKNTGSMGGNHPPHASRPLSARSLGQLCRHERRRNGSNTPAPVPPAQRSVIPPPMQAVPPAQPDAGNRPLSPPALAPQYLLPA